MQKTKRGEEVAWRLLPAGSQAAAGVGWRATQALALGAALALAALGSGCGDDCRKKVKDGDFELSQGNIPRAIQLYERAIALGGCPDAEAKKATAESLRPRP